MRTVTTTATTGTSRVSPDPRALCVALVTGAGSGVGRAVAHRLAARGHDVALLGRTSSTLETTALGIRALGRRALACVADVADRPAVEAALARVRETLGPVLVLVNAAGIAESSPILPPDDALFDRTMATNVRGPFIVSTGCFPDMKAAGRGRVVNVASTAALEGSRYTAAYVASKHALLGLTRAMALDVERWGVTVNALCPGFLDTPMTARTIDRIVESTGRTHARALADVLASAGQDRLLPPETVADAALRLIAEEPGTTNGKAIRL